MTTQTLTTTCCIAGGGPAGMMLGWLLARMGVDVIVLEKHADFFRDFRGDTVHPSTLESVYELGLLEDFLARPHQKTYRLNGFIGNTQITLANFSKLPVHAPFIAFMPQWDFLNFIAEQARAYPNFKLIMKAELTGLLTSGHRITGGKFTTPEGELQIESTLFIGADGRHSKARELAGMRVRDYGAPIDVLWFRLSRKPGDMAETTGKFLPGSILVLINRQDYWQCGFVIPKGQFELIKRDGLDVFRQKIAENATFLSDRVSELADWEQIKLLTVKVDRLEEWHREGLLCIGDAAHAMSPVGGVGINLAVQDAIATVNLLGAHLRDGTLKTEHLGLIEKRRLWPVRMTQRLQLFMHKRVIFSVLQSGADFNPWLFRLLTHFPPFRYVTAYIVGIGFRPERVKAW